MRRASSVIALIVLVGAGCSSDSATGPGGGAGGGTGGVPPITPRTIALTTVSGHALPAVYVRDQGDGWADSGTVTIQPDSVVAFRLYESATFPAGQPHVNQASTLYFTSGIIAHDSTVLIHYLNATVPDTAFLNHDGSITLHLTGGSGNARTSFGTWVFASDYHGPPLNPAPRVTDLAPDVIAQYSPVTTLHVRGSSFMPTTTATWAGTAVPVTYVSPQRIDLAIDSTLTLAADAYQIRIANPSPGGGTYYFTYRVTNPVPTATSLSPATVHAGTKLGMMVVNGTNFSPLSVVTWNGATRTTTFLNRTAIEFVVPDADVAVAGTAKIVVNTPTPGGGTTDPLTLTITGVAPQLLSQATISVHARVLAGDPSQPIVYAGTDGTDPTHPHSLVAFDGPTGQALWALDMGATPKVLAVSADGQFVYVGVQEDSMLRRVATATHAVDLRISLGSGPLGAYRATQVLASPDDPHTIAVQRECVCSAPYPYTDTGLTVYDDTVARPTSTPSVGNLPPIFTYGASGGVIYGRLGSTVYQVTVTSTGATMQTLKSAESVNGGTGPELLYGSGALYTTYGYDYDVTAQKSLGNLPSLGAFPQTIAISRDGRTLYRITLTPAAITAFDLTQRTGLGSVQLNGGSGQVSSLVRWGSDGLAYILSQSGNIELIRADLVH